MISEHPDSGRWLKPLSSLPINDPTDLNKMSSSTQANVTSRE